ncbi:ATP-binding protein [Ideonella sp. B508-1]|uniref:sensor histidine kinase n=1 Tax=Ideonella sp. B508-1 TaxID=137716 RepID=UPI0003B76478|nr:ATP-binding protein [Ideonella sp. B508-1]
MPASLTVLSPPDAQPLRQRLLRSGLLLLGVLAWVALGSWVGYRWNERAGLENLSAVANERLELYAATLESELARYAYLPSLIAADTDVRALLLHPQSDAAREAARLTLARIGVRAGASEVMLTDAEGRLLVSSDPNGGNTPAAELAKPADHFARNPGDGSTDYLFVHPVVLEGSNRGRVVLKLNLAPLEATWVDLGARSQSERLLVLDESDTVVITSVPRWKYRWLAPNPGEIGPLGPPPQANGQLQLAVERQLSPSVSLVRVPTEDGALPPRLLRQERALWALGGRLLSLSDPSEVWRQARTAAWGGAAAGALVASLLLYLFFRRRAERQLLQARNALQQTHDQLERQVDLRTTQLRTANEELKRQIAQRVLAEDELQQASKLAVLGQMSTGISHEINQPLTALRVLSRNSLRLLEAGRHDDVASNLRTIDEMSERMGRIVTQLKSFARKDSLRQQPVSLALAVRNVLLMLDHRLRHQDVKVVQNLPEELSAQGDANRLEQVLLNLAGNALDAMASTDGAVLTFQAWREGERVWVAVEDNGPGIDEAQMDRLFEPFYTTKPAGQGLGLGLVISAKIVREFGGTLRAQRTAQGMRFEFDLAAEAPSPATEHGPAGPSEDEHV